MTVPAKKYDKGKLAEAVVAARLEELNQSKHFAYHRYPDARAARGALAAQPADFLIASMRPGVPPRVIHLEVKETISTTRLPRTKIRQLGMLKKFSMGGITPYVLVNCPTLSRWCVFDKDDLFPSDRDMPVSYSLTSNPKWYATAEAAIESILAS